MADLIFGEGTSGHFGGNIQDDFLIDTMFAMGFVDFFLQDDFFASLQKHRASPRYRTTVSLVGGSAARQIRSICAWGPLLCCSACESPQSERRDRPGIACRRECLPHIVETDQALRVVESASHT